MDVGPGCQLPTKHLPYRPLHGHRKHPSHLARLRAWARWRPVEGQTLRIVLGHFICFSCFLAPWHVLPVFLDLKIAADPNLPGLTEKNLPITTTAIFLGWLVGSVCLKRLMEAFNKEQLVAGCACGLVLVTLATVTLLDLTAGNLVIFTSIRFVYGILLNITGIQIVHIQELMPGRENQVSVAANIGYCIVLILMSWMCGGPTFSMDWRLEAIFWNGLPMLVGLALIFPNFFDIFKKQNAHPEKEMKGKTQSEKKAMLSMDTINSMFECMVTFLACGCGFYGLSYCAGKLSTDVYLSTILLSGADILGYMAALTANSWGRTRLQGACFALAGCCLFLCSNGTPGSLFVILPAMVGRLCLDICFTTIYLGLVEDFSESAQMTVLPACEIVARIGGIIAPYCGTLPLYVSCQIFGFLCVAAAGATVMQSHRVPAKSNQAALGSQPAEKTQELEKELASIAV